MANENNVVDNIVEGTEHLDEDSIELVGVADVEKSIEDEADDAEALIEDDTAKPEASVEDEVEAEETLAEDEAEEPEASVEDEVEAEETLIEDEAEEIEASVGDDDEALADEEGGDTEAEDLVPRPDNTQWYVVHSYSGYENKVEKNLLHRIESMSMQDKIFQVVVPTEEEVELKDGHRRTIERRVFPGYILVEMVLDEDSWYVVRNTPGVTGFVGSGNKPTALRQEEVDKILKRMEAEAPKVKVSFKVGERVRIVEGPFEDFMGTVDEIDLDRTRVRVLVNFFGRETPIELDFLQVERS
jgi:transcriptional antiterminator NusG